MDPFAPWLVPGLALLARLLAVRGRPAAPWDARVDLGAAAVIGVAGAAFAALWTTPPTFSGWALTASDFSHYCQSVWSVALDDPTLWVAQRPRLPGVVAGVLADTLGVVDALAVGALVGTALLYAGLYLWARALHSRLAGVCAVLLGCALSPVSQLSRTLTFYPTITACFVLCLASVAVAARSRTAASFLAVGLGAGLAMLTDVRGLSYALAALGFGAIFALREGRGAPLRLALMVTPVVVSWFFGPAAFPEDTPTLEFQVAIWLSDACAQTGHPDPGPFTGRGFVWGYGSPLDALRALAWIARAQAEMPPEVTSAAVTVREREDALRPWVGLFAPAGLVALVGLRRRPWLLLALVGTLLPFATNTSVVLHWLPRSRYLAGGMAAFAVLGAVAFATLAEGALGAEDRRVRRDKTVLASLLAGGLLFGAVAGFFPSHLSPFAPWRERHRESGTDPRAPIERAANGGSIETDLSCLDALRADHARGLPYGSRLYGLDVTVIDPVDPWIRRAPPP